MLETILRLFLAYLTFVQPIMYGAQLCKKENPDPQQVTNVTLALVFSWLMELADVMFLSSFIAARTVYVLARIVVCLYFSHPTFLGALQLYEKVFARAVDAYAPAVDSLFMQHMDAIGQSGIVHYSTTVCMSLFRVAMEVVDIARRLLESTAVTEVPAAKLRRRLSQDRDEPVDEDGANAGDRPENQYDTASVVAKVRQTIGESPQTRSPVVDFAPSPPVRLPQSVYYPEDEQADEAMLPWSQSLPTPSPPPPPAAPPRLHRGHASPRNFYADPEGFVPGNRYEQPAPDSSATAAFGQPLAAVRRDRQSTGSYPDYAGDYRQAGRYGYGEADDTASSVSSYASR